ncbi:general odorant-binding protein 56d-like [Episyrphus balteatus]|uniref:general odorant-binding protein 56d-like n=1 Tax=Episyrphus balteatus TaxID=286459 RepID=UPI0024853294|nr:general odorant-binding protein 56d-like [Episyrphus balteatus]
MKFIILVTLFAVACFDATKADESAETRKFMADCRKQFHINDVQKYWELNIGTLAIADVTRDMKCYLNCFMEKVGVLKDGRLQPNGSAKFNDYADEDTAQKLLKSCRNEVVSDKCETGYNLHQCFVKDFGYYTLQYYQKL